MSCKGFGHSKLSVSGRVFLSTQVLSASEQWFLFCSTNILWPAMWMDDASEDPFFSFSFPSPLSCFKCCVCEVAGVYACVYAQARGGPALLPSTLFPGDCLSLHLEPGWQAAVPRSPPVSASHGADFSYNRETCPEHLVCTSSFLPTVHLIFCTQETALSLLPVSRLILSLKLSQPRTFPPVTLL